METELKDRVGTFTPDVEDRRRLVVTTIFAVAEEAGTAFAHAARGQIILDNATDENDVLALGDAVARRIHKMLTQGR